jgi:hydrogenase/urease accessory protein HupE
MKRWLLALLLPILLLASAAGAHELSMAEMEVRQISPREFLWQWTASGSRPVGDALRPQWPDGCGAEHNVLRCGEAGLSGTLAVDGVGKRYSAAMVRVYWQDGQMRVYTITAAQPTVQLFGSADDKRGMGEIARAYTVLGVAHILNGWDHLLFVVSLLFLVGFNRQLVLALTAFTLAHSLTLGLSALGWLTLRRPPVEAAIALSIVLVAGEALHRRQTLSRRWPALVAFVFGLVHGLGFAGALKEIGLPQNHLLMALLTFNVGVEVGQLLVVAVGYVVYRALLTSLSRAELARVPALYAIGAVAAYWSIGRIVGIAA